MKPLCSLQWEKDTLVILDQTGLPSHISYLRCHTCEDVAAAIKKLSLRGAPAIGVGAAYAMVLAAIQAKKNKLTGDALREYLAKAAQMLRASRPTAVNLFWALSEMEYVIEKTPEEQLTEALLARAAAIHEEDRRTCEKIAQNGAMLFQKRKALSLLTHCNTGALATTGIGTALGVILQLHKEKRLANVYVDETRPLLQGARLTATELMAAGVPCQLLSDNMAGYVMRLGRVDGVIVGADRIAANGDTANKIGTYALAVLAAYHEIPFYVAAPYSTFDFSIETGRKITIEQRDPDEVRWFNNQASAPPDVPVFNPAFDVTPHELITAIITEKGIIAPPNSETISVYERSLSHDNIHN